MSVINQMLRDLEARGEPLPAQGIAGGASGTKRAPLPGITAFTSHRKRQRKVRALVWGALACLVVVTMMTWQWQHAQIDAARKVRRPLGWAEFKDAINTNPNALLPAALTPVAVNLDSVISVTQSEAPVQAAAESRKDTEAATQSTPEPSEPSKPTAALVTDRAAAAPPNSTQATKAAKSPASHSRVSKLKTEPKVRTPDKPAASEPAQLASLAPDARARSTKARSDAVVLRTAQDSGQVEALVARAAALIARGRNVEASALLQKALAAQPDHIPARQALAALQSEAGQSAAALVTLLEGTAVDAGLFAPLAATLQVELGDASGALDTLARIPKAEQTPQHHALAAGIAQRAGQHHAAVASFKHALQSHADEGVWWMGLAVSLEALGEYAQAYQAYEHAAEAPTLDTELRNFVKNKMSNIAPTSQLDNAPGVPAETP